MEDFTAVAIAEEVAAGPDQRKSRRPRSKTEQQSISEIQRADRRAKLEPRRAPHWKRIANGRYIGFRYMTKGSPGTWLARCWLVCAPLKWDERNIIGGTCTRVGDATP